LSKQLSIIRHGKSNRDNPELDDIDIPLLPKGIKRTIRMCKYMKKQKIYPDYIICSPAERAVKTAEIIISELKLSIIPQIHKELYGGSIDCIDDVISDMENNINHLLIVGHNPVLTNYINTKIKNINLDWLPTSGLVTINFDFKKWAYISTSIGNTGNYITPKLLKKQ
jgi:phosphohistidine phosphatase